MAGAVLGGGGCREAGAHSQREDFSLCTDMGAPGGLSRGTLQATCAE